MIVYEVLHSMKTKQKWHIGNMTLKLDRFKAYDYIELAYIESILRKLGFGEDGCLSSWNV